MVLTYIAFVAFLEFLNKSNLARPRVLELSVSEDILILA